MTQLAINVLGMTCEHCAARVRDALGQLPDVKVSRVDHEEGLATIESGRWYAPEAFEKAVGDAGYHFAGASVMDEVTIPVGGMHCNNCARKVNNELAVVSGVKRVDVDLDGERVTVTGRAHLGEMIDAIRRAGFTVGEPPAQPDVPEVVDVAGGEPESGAACPVQLNLSGMSCASCVSTVERALSGVPGVERASVNFADQSAYVVTRGDSAALVDAVKRAGYGASIRQDDDLESRDAELAARLRSTYIKSGVALALGAALMGTMQFNLLPTPDATAFWLGVSAVVLAAMAYAGGHFFVGAVSSARHGAMTMDTLIALGTGTAFIYSFLIIVAPELVPPASRHLFFEAAVFIIGFINLGKGFEDNAKGKTSLAVKKLIGLAPKSASRIREGDEEETVPIEQVVVGDRLRIRPGETIPVDGVVESGNGSVDESMLTGESVPVDKTDGAKLVAGTLVMNGTLVMIAKQVGGETVLARMIDLVRDAQNSKPAIGRLTDRIASVFVPAVIAIALATGVAWYLVGPEPKVSYVVVTMMSVLIIACPCALGLAIPMSIMVGMGRAASAGMLIKNSEALQAAARLTLIVVDKTGTLTAGRPRVTRVWAQDDETGMLSLAGALEKLSEHPLARAVVQYVQEQGIGETTVSDFSMTSGGGVTGTLDGQTVAVGNPNYLKSLGMSRRFDAQPEGGSTAIYVGRGHEVLGFIELFDELKPAAKEAIGAIKSLGIRVAMLTGDNRASATRVAGELGLDDWEAEVQPERKLEFVKEQQLRGEKVGMVGDGINDSLALGAADVGFAMGEGTDIAIESADVALLANDLGGVSRAVRLSRLTMRNIYENLFGAFAYNTLLIPVAAGVLYPVMGLLINPVFAGIAMAASSVTVVANANRLRLVKL